jgi:UDP-N-acetylglucosamine 4,6-dehydratase
MSISENKEKTKLLIIGGTGSLGHELVKFYSDKYNEIHIISRDEDKQWRMKKLFNSLLIYFYIGDIRNKTRMENLLLSINPTTIILASAMKHIDICQSNISECIETNIIGVKNIAELIENLSVKKLMSCLKTFVFISTDKACSPINVYGCCKSISENMFVDLSKKLDNPKIVVLRYGNVLNSRGSVIPLFQEIAENKEKTFFPVTSSQMTRFFLTLEESIKLIDNAINHGESGDIFIPSTSSFIILDIANLFSEKYGKPVKIVGIRDGEKIHESLINSNEMRRTIFNKKLNNYIIKPESSIVDNMMNFDSLNLIKPGMTEYSSKDFIKNIANLNYNPFV